MRYVGKEKQNKITKKAYTKKERSLKSSGCTRNSLD
jgi:hypothetical protein